jgi:hypothetical protein
MFEHSVLDFGAGVSKRVPVVGFEDFIEACNQTH